MKELVIKLYKKFEYLIKYTFSAGISFAIDLSLFTLFNYILKNLDIKTHIILATIGARIISSFINYYLNKNKVFKHGNNKIDKTTMIKFYALTIIQMLVSSFTVDAIFSATKYNETIIKFFVECIIFVVNFVVQKFYIFKNK